LLWAKSTATRDVRFGPSGPKQRARKGKTLTAVKKVQHEVQMDVTARREGECFRVFYRHYYPRGVEETRDSHRFNTLAEAEKFAETMRQVERFYRDLG